MAIGATLFDSYADTGTSTDSFSTSNSKSPVSNRLYHIAVVLTSGSGAAWPTVTLSGWGITWAQVSNVQRTTVEWLGVFEGLHASPSTGVLTVTFTGKAVNGKVVAATEVTGIDTADPIVGTPGTGGISTGTTRTVSLSSYADTDNAAIAAFFVGIAAATDVTPEANWTEIADASYDSPSTHCQVQFRADAGAIPDTSCTASWDGSNVNCGGIIVELSAAAVAGVTAPKFAMLGVG